MLSHIVLAVVLKDITQMELGNDTFVSPGVINFEKMQLIAQVFMKMSALQFISYALQKVYHITDWLQSLHTISDADVRKYSLMIEVWIGMVVSHKHAHVQESESRCD
jgi:hypothetical protein